MSRQDRQGVRLPADVERKWGFKKRFDNAMDDAEAASNSVMELDKKLDQTEVFNRLTNNGQSQGVFIGEDGQVYINASYLVTGILKSKDATTFYLDLVNGILKGRFEEFTIQGKTVEDIASDKSDSALTDAKKYADEKNTEAKSYADKVASDAVNGQTQESLFKILTNNGKEEGIYVVNGSVLINASYISTGILASKDGKTFYLDLDNNNVSMNLKSVTIDNKTVYWHENEDGTFTLMGS